MSYRVEIEDAEVMRSGIPFTFHPLPQTSGLKIRFKLNFILSGPVIITGH